MSFDKARRLLNIVTGVVLVLLVALLANRIVGGRFLWTPSDPAAANPYLPPEIEGEVVDPTLLLALDIACSDCDANVAFYRNLLSESRTAGFRTVAVMSSPVDLSLEYLRARGLQVDEVRQAPLPLVGAIGTPTTLLVDREGRVSRRWIGALQPKRMREIVQAFGVSQSVLELPAEEHPIRPAKFESLTPAALQELIQRNEVVLVDTRPRFIFAQAHVAGAINIPYDELSVRAPIELPRDKQIVVYCQYYQPCAEELLAQYTSEACALAASVLSRAGFTNVSVFTPDMTRVQESGMTLTTSNFVNIEATPM